LPADRAPYPSRVSKWSPAIVFGSGASRLAEDLFGGVVRDPRGSDARFQKTSQPPSLRMVRLG